MLDGSRDLVTMEKPLEAGDWDWRDGLFTLIVKNKNNKWF